MFKVRVKIVCLAFLLGQMIGLAQSSKLDSVYADLKKDLHDTVRVKKLLKLGQLLSKVNPDSSLSTLKQTLDIVIDKGLHASANERKFYNLKEGQLLYLIGMVHFKFKEMKDAIPYLMRSTEVRKKYKDETMVVSLVGLGVVQMTIGKMDTALKIFLSAKESMEKLGNYERGADIYNNLAIAYLAKGMTEKALDCHYKSLKIRQDKNDQAGMAQSYNNIAIIYSQQLLKKKALEYFDKSLDAAIRSGSKKEIALAYNNIALIYVDESKFKEALEYNLKSLALREEIQNIQEIGMSYSNLGDLYLKTNELEKSIEYYNKSLKIGKESGEADRIFFSYSGLTDVYKKKNDFSKAEEFAKNALKVAEDMQVPIRMMAACRSLHSIYEAKGELAKAYPVYKQYIQLRDSVSNDDLRKMTLQKNYENEFALMEKEVKMKAEAEKRILVQKQEDERKRNMIIIFSIVFILIVVSVFLVLVFRGLKEKRKANEIISKQKEIVETKQKEVLESIRYAKRIQISLMANEKYIERIMKKLRT